MADDDSFLIKAADVHFGRSGDGEIVMRTGGRFVTVGNVMAASPITDPRRMVSVRDEQGEEVGILDDVTQLDPTSQRIILDELERVYFMPRIVDIIDICEDLGVVSWEVETDKGERSFQVRNIRQNVRKLDRRRIIIKDVDGNRYEVRDWAELPGTAERLLQPYL